MIFLEVAQFSKLINFPLASFVSVFFLDPFPSFIQCIGSINVRAERRRRRRHYIGEVNKKGVARYENTSLLYMYVGMYTLLAHIHNKSC